MRENEALTAAEALARVYVNALAVANGASLHPMSRSNDTTLDTLLGLQDVVPNADTDRLRVDQTLAAILTARCIATEPFLPGRLHRGEDVILVIETIHAEWVDLVDDVITTCATPKGSKKTILSQDGSEKSHAPDRGNMLIHKALGRGGPVVGISTSPSRHLPSALMRTAEVRITLPSIDAWAIRLLLEAMTGQKYAGTIDEMVIRAAEIGDLSLAIRHGKTPAECLSRLAELVSGKAQFTGSGPMLEQLYGYGEAATWGLELVDDIKEYKAGRLKWADVSNRSILLSSEPGLGKTSFARALARSMGAHLVATSVADWNAAPHLGATLQAMRGAFAEARRNRPSVLLIDEFEGISARNRLSGDYTEYWTQIVNQLLELLSNESDLEGTVIVTTTNHPEKIDTALLRSGRIDNIITLQKPNHPDLANIFRYCLGADSLPQVDLMPLALAATGATGADVTKWVMRAKAIARRQGVELSMDHLLTEIRGNAPSMSPEVRARVAVHEAGHAVLARFFKIGTVRAMAIVPTGGRTEVDFDQSLDLNEVELTRTMAFFLAGRAAEELAIGTAGGGSGGTDGNSDLERATDLAIKAESAFGFGKTLGLVHMRIEHHSTLVMMPQVLAAVKERLDNAMDLARQVLEVRQQELNTIAQLLDRMGYVPGSELQSLSVPPTDVSAAA